MAFIQRRIEVTIKLATAAGTDRPHVFADGTNTLTIRNARMSVRVQNAGSLGGSHAQVSIWGLTQNVMNSLSTLGMVISQIPKDILAVTAGDDDTGMSTVFVGTIVQAYADYSGAPDVAFHFECNAGAAENAIPFAATSYKGGADVVAIMSALAQRNGWGFENNGVKAQLSNPYFSGTAKEQVYACAAAARIRVELVGASAVSGGPGNVLVIMPLYGARTGLGIPLIGPKPVGSMIGYPSYTQQGIVVRTLFDPRLAMGGQFKLETSLPQQSANGIWNVMTLDLALDALLPKGQWMSTVHAYNPQFPAPIPPQATP